MAKRMSACEWMAIPLPRILLKNFSPSTTWRERRRVREAISHGQSPQIRAAGPRRPLNTTLSALDLTLPASTIGVKGPSGALLPIVIAELRVATARGATGMTRALVHTSRRALTMNLNMPGNRSSKFVCGGKRSQCAPMQPISLLLLKPVCPLEALPHGRATA